MSDRDGRNRRGSPRREEIRPLNDRERQAMDDNQRNDQERKRLEQEIDRHRSIADQPPVYRGRNDGK